MGTRRRGLVPVIALTLVLPVAGEAMALGSGRVLQDAELDAVFARGSIVADVSLTVRVADRFDLRFASATTIRPVDGAGAGEARVDLLGGAVSVTAGGEQGLGGTAGAVTVKRALEGGVGELSVRVGPGDGAQPAGPATGGIAVTFSPSAPGANQMLGVFARNANVETRVDLVVGARAAFAAGARATLIRHLVGGIAGR